VSPVPRPRRRAVGLIVGAGVLFFLGTNVQAGWLFVIAACLMGTVVAGVLLPARMVRGLEVDRRAPGEVHQGDEVMVELAITDRSRGMRLGILVDDPFLEPAALAVPTLRPGARAEVVTVRVAVRRGLQASVPVVARSSAPFGVGEHRRTLAVAGPETLVLPRVVPLGSLPFVRPAATSDHAIHTAPRRGHGPEYLGIREYRPGDSMRHVHWPSTARTGVVMVREFEEEQTRRLAIVVDGGWDAGDAWTPLDRVCAAAASVALAALAQGHGARLVVTGGGDAEVLGRADGTEILRRLALVTPDARYGFAEQLDRVSAGLRGVEATVLVFPARRGNDPAVLEPVVAMLADRFAHVVAIPVEVTEAESRREALPSGAWTELEDRLRRAGAEVFPWRDGDDLAAVLSPADVVAAQ
jgi:uncharacterized protein (DUF58 family)